MASDPESNLPYRMGQLFQALLLGLAIGAVLLKLLKSSAELTFRYGGF